MEENKTLEQSNEVAKFTYEEMQEYAVSLQAKAIKLAEEKKAIEEECQQLAEANKNLHKWWQDAEQKAKDLKAVVMSFNMLMAAAAEKW